MVERSDSQRETAFREVTTRCFMDQQEVPLAVLQTYQRDPLPV